MGTGTGNTLSIADPFVVRLSNHEPSFDRNRGFVLREPQGERVRLVARALSVLSQAPEQGASDVDWGVMLSGTKHLVAVAMGARPFARLRRPQGDRNCVVAGARPFARLRRPQGDRNCVVAGTRPFARLRRPQGDRNRA